MSVPPGHPGARSAQPADVPDRQAELDALHAQVAEIRRQIHALQSSTSWRITAPVRSLVTVLRRLRSGASAAAPAASETGVPNLAMPLPIRVDGDGPRPGLPTVLVVSQEASRTGAPILAWNLCKGLRGRCNVVTLLLRGGSLEEQFAQVSDVVAGPVSYAARDPLALAPLLQQLLARWPVDFAIVNSIDSGACVAPLAELGIGSVLLVHEFFSYTRPLDAAIDALLAARAVVFPAALVRDDALHPRTRRRIAEAIVQPQGKCEVPEDRRSAGARASDLVNSLRRFREEGDAFVVLGAGSVEYRKGVDLFIATAALARRRAPVARMRFAWIGRGFDPDDQRYGAYLQHQLKTAPGDDVVIAAEIPDIEQAYPLADAFFLSSRLDPMPNVAIDALTAGVPVICFETATGLAEILQAQVDTARFVLPHSDVRAAADALLSLRAAHATRDAQAELLRSVAARHFRMQDYVQRLLELGTQASIGSAQRGTVVRQRG
ncbi:MAG: glycosyltransferase [Burkholderiaceae bacterium]